MNLSHGTYKPPVALYPAPGLSPRSFAWQRAAFKKGAVPGADNACSDAPLVGLGEAVRTAYPVIALFLGH